jgi:hypothetical protein
MKYIPICFALSLAILYVIIGLPPSMLSKAAAVALGVALLYFAFRAKASISFRSLKDDAGTADEKGSTRVADPEQAAPAKRPGK